MPRSQKRKPSVWEWLAVLVIAAGVVAFLRPVFNRHIEEQRQQSCASNLDQITLAIIQYESEYDGVYPPARICGHVPDQPPCVDGQVTLGWMDLVRPYAKSYGMFKCPDDPTAAVPIPPSAPRPAALPPGAGFVWNGKLKDFSKAGGANRSSYAINGNLLAIVFNHYFAGDPQLPYPATTILVFDFAPNQGSGDGGEQKGEAYTIVREPYPTISPECHHWSPAKITPTNQDSNFFGELFRDQQADERRLLSSTRHNGGANYAFTDGHTAWLRPQSINGECGLREYIWDTGNDGVHPDFRI